MTVFGAYSKYYDLVYRDKDYQSEAAYVCRLIERYSAGAKSILDLGCGTGSHAFALAAMGYDVAGIDRSAKMIDVAMSRLSPKNLDGNKISFGQGDIRSVRLQRKFDIVISLFHVMSYQTTDDDLASAIGSARAHLAPEGLFIFDCWYGPAVLADPPTVRIKRLQDDKIEVVRIAEPVMHAEENRVDVNYDVFIKDRFRGGIEEIKETHCMRYLFKQEIADMAALHKMELIHAEEWMTGREPGADTWGVCFICRG